MVPIWRSDVKRWNGAIGLGAGPGSTISTITINGRNLHRVAYKNTVAHFLRLPDGNVNGEMGYLMSTAAIR